MQEYLGYCLIPTNRGQTMMLLKGNGGEGKSRIGVVMQKMLGDNLKTEALPRWSVALLPELIWSINWLWWTMT